MSDTKESERPRRSQVARRGHGTRMLVEPVSKDRGLSEYMLRGASTAVNPGYRAMLHAIICVRTVCNDSNGLQEASGTHQAVPLPPGLAACIPELSGLRTANTQFHTAPSTPVASGSHPPQTLLPAALEFSNGASATPGALTIFSNLAGVRRVVICKSTSLPQLARTTQINILQAKERQRSAQCASLTTLEAAVYAQCVTHECASSLASLVGILQDLHLSLLPSAGLTLNRVLSYGEFTNSPGRPMMMCTS